MYPVTIVSALYNIQREQVDGRTWESYLSWFGGTLKLNCPMVLFVDASLQDFILSHRSPENTRIICQKLEEIPLYKLKPDIDTIINSTEFQQIADERLENQISLYSILMFSKFFWLEQVALDNPFDSQFFFWLDAGTSRFAKIKSIRPYPGKLGMKLLHKNPGKFFLQYNKAGSYRELIEQKILPKAYLKDARSIVMGGHFGGDAKAIINVKKEVYHVLIEDLIKQNYINQEQIVLGYLLKSKPDLFYPILRHYPRIPYTLYILEKFSRNREEFFYDIWKWLFRKRNIRNSARIISYEIRIYPLIKPVVRLLKTIRKICKK